MADKYISAEAAYQAIEAIDENAGARGSGFTDPDRIMRDSAFYALDAVQPADVVSRDCYDRILAENDTMREMLAQIGKKPGDKMDDVRPVVRGTWIETAPINEETGVPLIVKGPHLKCSNCGSVEFQRDFCPNCGADMREAKDG